MCMQVLNKISFLFLLNLDKKDVLAVFDVNNLQQVLDGKINKVFNWEKKTYKKLGKRLIQPSLL